MIEWGGLFREIPAVSDQDQGEYDLADVPEPRQPKAPITPGKPLPRLWKTEPDEDEEEELKEAAEAKKKQEAAQSAQGNGPIRRGSPAGKEGETQGKQQAARGRGLRKEGARRKYRRSTTYEARQPGRLIVGGALNRRLHRNLRLDLLQAVHLMIPTQ